MSDTSSSMSTTPALWKKLITLECFLARNFEFHNMPEHIANGSGFSVASVKVCEKARQRVILQIGIFTLRFGALFSLPFMLLTLSELSKGGNFG